VLRFPRTRLVVVVCGVHFFAIEVASLPSLLDALLLLIDEL